MPMYDPCHPGELILDSMEAMGWDAARCAQKLGLEVDALTLTLDGQAPITPEIAVALERIGWSNAAFWLRVQKSYDEDQIRMRTEPPPVWEDISEFSLSELPHPGFYLRDSMDERGMSADDVAKALGVSLSATLDVLNERAPVMPEIARALERMGWGSSDHWLLNQRSHDESQALAREREKTAAATAV